MLARKNKHFHTLKHERFHIFKHYFEHLAHQTNGHIVYEFHIKSCKNQCALKITIQNNYNKSVKL